MSHQLMISDDAYAALLQAATEKQMTPEALIESWAEKLPERDPVTDPRYQSFEEFFEELGMTPEQIRKAQDDAHLR